VQKEVQDYDHAPGRWQRTLRSILQFAEAIETSPMEELFDRILRLEQDVAALKKNRQGSGGDETASGQQGPRVPSVR
jgi:polyhydroxyalkanoate synthesis regulator phasin